MSSPGSPERPSLLEALAKIGSCLAEAGIEHVVIGGMAVVAWSHPRSTVDIDLLVAAPAIRPEEVLSVLEAGGFTCSGDIHHDVQMAGFRLERATTGGFPVPVDVLVSQNTMAIEIVGRAVDKRFGGVSVRVPTVEDLIVLKLQANRRQDIADCEALIVANRKNLDHDLLERQAAVFDVAEELRTLLR